MAAPGTSKGASGGDDTGSGGSATFEYWKSDGWARARQFGSEVHWNRSERWNRLAEFRVDDEGNQGFHEIAIVTSPDKTNALQDRGGLLPSFP